MGKGKLLCKRFPLLDQLSQLTDFKIGQLKPRHVKNNARI